MEPSVDQPAEERWRPHELATVGVAALTGTLLLGQVLLGPSVTYGWAVAALDVLLLGTYGFFRWAGGKWAVVGRGKLRRAIAEAAVVASFLVLSIANLLAGLLPAAHPFHAPAVSLLAKAAILGSLLGLVVQESHRARERHEHPLLMLRPPQLVAVGFAIVILLGTLLLSLPEATRPDLETNAVDALFTATSAVCVTGLIVKSTPEHWSTFGQVVILVLLQAGGLGIMTMSALLMVALRRRLSLRHRTAMLDVLEMDEGEEIGHTLRYILKLTLLAEFVGAVALFVDWSMQPDVLAIGRRAYLALFHSVSAFCNAGFSLFPDSLERYRHDLSVNWIVASLVILGGLGFPVVRDLHRMVRARRARVRPRLSLHSKIVLFVSAVLVVCGMLLVLLTERGATLQGEGSASRLVPAAFQSITARTAGFNTIPIGGMTAAGLMTLTVLMFIGASPASTGGGIKTSTLAVLLATNKAMMRHEDKPIIWRRAIPESVRHRAVVIASLAFAWVVTATFILCLSEDAEFLDLLFETVSAVGTVGLSTGVTEHLTTFGRLVIALTMFLGRIGPLTFAVAIQPRSERATHMFAEEDALVG